MSDLFIPEAQKNPHHWAATFGGHAWVGLGPWGIVAMYFDIWTAAWLVPLLYFFVWEGLQFALSRDFRKVMIWDSILDSVAVAFGCYAATLACYGVAMDSDTYRIAAVMCWGGSVSVQVTGWKVRA